MRQLTAAISRKRSCIVRGKRHPCFQARRHFNSVQSEMFRDAACWFRRPVSEEGKSNDSQQKREKRTRCDGNISQWRKHQDTEHAPERNSESLCCLVDKHDRDRWPGRLSVPNRIRVFASSPPIVATGRSVLTADPIHDANNVRIVVGRRPRGNNTRHPSDTSHVLPVKKANKQQRQASLPQQGTDSLNPLPKKKGAECAHPDNHYR